MPRGVATVLMFVAVLGAGCDRPKAVASVRKSPDGTMTLTTSVNRGKANPTRYFCVVVDITDASGRTLHHEVTPASDTQRWSIRWMGNDAILLESSDVGIYEIRRQPDGTWAGELTAR